MPTTPNRGYPYPATTDPATVPADLGEALSQVDADVQSLVDNADAIEVALDGKAGTNHTHSIGSVTDLQTALDGKVDDTDPRLTDARTPTVHTHTAEDVTDLRSVMDADADAAVAAYEQEVS